MWSNKYLIIFLLIVFCLINFNECKSRKKSNSVQKSKTKSSLTTKLVKSKNVGRTSKDIEIQNAMQTLKNHKVIESNAKLINKNGKQKLVLNSKKKISKASSNLNEVMKKSKLQASTSKPVINFSNGMSREERDKAVDIISDVIRKSNTSSDLVECVRKELERQLGLRSNVIISSKPFMDQSFAKIPGSVVMQLSLTNGKNKDQILISLFGLMKDKSVEEKSNALMRRAQKLSPKIIDSLMSSDMRQEITKMSTRVVRNAKTIEEVSDQLSEQLSDKFGPHWHSVVGFKDMLSVDDHRKTSVFFLNMDFGDMRVSIFK